jgi:hypothetical protein
MSVNAQMSHAVSELLLFSVSASHFVRSGNGERSTVVVERLVGTGELGCVDNTEGYCNLLLPFKATILFNSDVMLYSACTSKVLLRKHVSGNCSSIDVLYEFSLLARQSLWGVTKVQQVICLLLNGP